MVLVVRLNLLPLSALDDLSRVLASSPAAKLGFVVTGAEETLQQQSISSGSTRRGEDPYGRGDTSGGLHADGDPRNGAAMLPDAAEQPYAPDR